MHYNYNTKKNICLRNLVGWIIKFNQEIKNSIKDYLEMQL